MGAAELAHEAIDHAMEVQAVVEAAFRQIDPVLGRNRHLFEEKLHFEGAQGRLTSRCWITHCMFEVAVIGPQLHAPNWNFQPAAGSPAGDLLESAPCWIYLSKMGRS